jgi:hypothetical protein
MLCWPRAPEDLARDAAEEIAACKNRPTRIETDIALIEAQISDIRNAMATKTWLVGVMLAQTFAILGGVAGLSNFCIRATSDRAVSLGPFPASPGTPALGERSPRGYPSQSSQPSPPVGER